MIYSLGPHVCQVFASGTKVIKSARPINSPAITKMKNNVQGFGHLVNHITQVLHQFLAIKEPLHSGLRFCQ
jgi:hypothetical protein